MKESTEKKRRRKKSHLHVNFFSFSLNLTQNTTYVNLCHCQKYLQATEHWRSWMNNIIKWGRKKKRIYWYYCFISRNSINEYLHLPKNHRSSGVVDQKTRTFDQHTLVIESRQSCTMRVVPSLEWVRCRTQGNASGIHHHQLDQAVRRTMMAMRLMMTMMMINRRRKGEEVILVGW